MVVIKNIKNINVPEHLNEAFFHETLEEGLREPQITLNEISFDYCTNPGDNYCSVIYRVLVTFEAGEAKTKERRSLIVKTIPISPELQFLQDVRVFLKEKNTYGAVLPRLEVISAGDKFGAGLYYTIKKPMQTIVFDDLKVLGYKLASRENGLDWAHSVLVLQQLAKFHAASMVLAKKDPSIAKHYTDGMLCDATVIQSDTFESMFGGMLKYMIPVVATWPGYEHITKELQRYLNNFRAITAKLSAPKPNDRYVVLNHGDMWTNNFMYAYDDEALPAHPTRLVFVDFQLSIFASPGCDLNFFLNTSVQLDILQCRREELIKVYYDAFYAALDYARFENIPTYEDLQHELRNRETYGLFGLFAFLPMVTMPKELSGDNSIESMTNEDVKRQKFEKIFQQPKLQQHLKYSLKRLEELNVFADY